MKSRVGLAVSVGLNLGLAGVLAWLWVRPPAPVEVPLDEFEVIGLEDSNATNDVQIRYVARPDFRFPTNLLGRFTWKAIEHTNYFRYVENLRAIRCPERTIQDIIVADVNDLYGAKWKELLQRQATEFRYWETGKQFPGMANEALESQAAELDAERRALLKELLGIDVKDSLVQLAAVDPMELALGFLSDEKRLLVKAARDEYAAARAALLAGAATNADVDEALRRLRDEHQTVLAGLMTPEELQRYELTTSPLAMALRTELSGFEPTEEEFRQIFEARKTQEEEEEATRVFLSAQIQVQEEAEAAERAAIVRQAATNAALLEQLGPERYAQLQRATDPNYQLLLRVSGVGEVSPVAANRMYEYSQIAQVEADKLRANSTLTLEEREIGLNAIRAETERTIQESMGDSALRTYREWREQQALLLNGGVRP